MKRIVVKIGTNTLTDKSDKLDIRYIGRIAKEIAELKGEGYEIVLVTSGAIRAGMDRLGHKSKPQTIPENQAVAAVGQSYLMRAYSLAFARNNQIAAQILLTREDLADRQRYLNARNTMMTLLTDGITPIVNENDTVAIDEIKVGDNDTLAALVGLLIEADLVVLFTDVEGLYANGKPEPGKKSEVIPVVKKITPTIEKIAQGPGTNTATGGMITKIRAARMLTNSGIPMVICNGRSRGILKDVVDEKSVGTLFMPVEQKLKSRKQWIAFCSRPKGRIVVNDGAREMVGEKGKSLLPAGIEKVEGKFGTGDLISVVDRSGKEFARGLANYTSVEVDKIKGKNSRDIEEILGYKAFDEVVHRDNMAVGVC